MLSLHLPPRPWPQAFREKVVKYGFEFGGLTFVLLVLKDVLH